MNGAGKYDFVGGRGQLVSTATCDGLCISVGGGFGVECVSACSCVPWQPSRERYRAIRVVSLAACDLSIVGPPRLL
jgi:hypothetical protein